MIIGLLFEDKRISGVDLCEPQKGNPGIGGTSYMFLMLAHYLSVFYPDVKIKFFRYGNAALPEKYEQIKLQDESDLFDKVDTDVFVFSVKDKGKEFYEHLDKCKIDAIGWAHNYISDEEADWIFKSNAVKRLVFVGRQMYDHYIDHRVIQKSCYIYNMFNCDRNEYYRHSSYKPIVTYVGSLTPQKGFHVLAKNWKQIHSKVPNAELHVIGGGNLYFKDAVLGEYGLAEETYENKFISDLTEDGKLMDSVFFHGVMGKDKVEVFHQTAVGVMNPTAETETFGISAVEMEACCIPVVTKKKNGLLDTTVNGKTGYLVDTEKELCNRIVELLIDTKKNLKMGSAAREFVSTEFSPQRVTKQWMQLIENIKANNQASMQWPNSYLMKDYKPIRCIICLLHRCKAFAGFPSLNGIKKKIKGC